MRPVARTAGRDSAKADANVAGPYTRPKMQRGTIGDGRQVELDGLYAEATQSLSSSAGRLAETTQRFRQAYAAGQETLQQLRDQLAVAGGPEQAALRARIEPLSGELALAKSNLARLELAADDLQRSRRFLERGATGNGEGQDAGQHDEAAESGAHGTDRTLRMHVMEAQESERSRLAEDLHDGPAQALANALFQLEIIETSVARDPTQTDAELRSLKSLLDRELNAVRDYISQLRPTLLEDGRLDDALRQARTELEAAGIQVDLELGAPDDRLDESRRTVVLRVAQEALRNARKHARASHVSLKTRVEPRAAGSAWLLEVRDDGRGFDLEDTLGRGGGRHFGLRFMRERADLIGAHLEIEPEPNGGTLVRLTIEDTERSQ